MSVLVAGKQPLLKSEPPPGLRGAHHDRCSGGSSPRLCPARAVARGWKWRCVKHTSNHHYHYYITLSYLVCYILVYYFMLHYILYYIISYHIILYYKILHYTIFYSIILYLILCVILWFIISYYIILCII